MSTRDDRKGWRFDQAGFTEQGVSMVRSKL